MSYDVLVVGGYTADLIFTGFPAMPELGEEVLAGGFDILPGEAYNSAAALHRLGLHVGWACDFGNDEISQLVLGQIRREGLDESLFVHHKRPLRRLTVAVSFPHDRSFFTYYDPPPRLTAEMRALTSTQARVLFIPGFYCGELFDAALLLARARGMQVLMDGNSGMQTPRLTDPKVRRAVSGVDLFLPNAREARMLTSESDLPSALRILGELCPLVVIKDGPKGAMAYHDREMARSPALSLTAVDTTGAGDVFNAGFLRSWLDGLPLETCLRWGCVTGGLSTLAAGATTRRITLADIQENLPRLPSA